MHVPSHLIVALALATNLSLQGLAAAQAPAGSPAREEVSFSIFVRGAQVGSEQVALDRTQQGWRISSSARLAPPIDVIVRAQEVEYDHQWQPIELRIDALQGGQPLFVQTRFSPTAASSEVIDAGQETRRTDPVSADTIVLSMYFFGAYEALAARLAGLEPGAELPVYYAPQTQVSAQLTHASAERIQIGQRAIAARRHQLTFHNPTGPLEVHLWSDADNRLLRVSIPSAQLEVVRSDIATVAARVATEPHPGDEDVAIPAAGFTLAATVTRPTGAEAPPPPWPAVVLVHDSGPVDRNQTIGDVPVFAELAGALADAGFLVVRYDKRGVAQSGGRAESATITDYADDARTVVQYLSRQRDVDRNRIAAIGHGEGGWVSLLAASREGRIAAVVLSATGSSAGEQMILEQQEAALSRLQLTEEERQERVALQQRIHQAVRTGEGWDEIPEPARQQADSAWFRSYLDFDPARIIPRVRQPVLVLHGEANRQVPMHHADRLEHMLAQRRGQRQVEVVRIPGIDHALARTAEGTSEAVTVDRDVSPEAVTPLVEWLRRVLAPRGR